MHILPIPNGCAIISIARLLNLLFLLLTAKLSYGQEGDIPVEVFAGNRAFAHQMYMTKYINDKSRFGYFGYLRYESPYADRKQATITGQSLFFYNIAGKISAGGGGYVTNDGFVPQIAIAYGRDVGELSFTVFGAVEPVKSPNGEIFALITYTPRLTKDGNWKLFAQFIGAYNFNFKNDFKYNFANQYLRLGLSHRGWQFGAGVDLLQLKGVDAAPSNNGIFFRRQF